MVKTRGGSTQGIESGSIGCGAPVESVRLTASVRQRKRSHHVEQQVEPVPTQGVSYEGGPRDMSLLRSYESHVAQRLWTSEDRGMLKVVTHDRKLKRPKNDYIRDIVDDFSLGPLIESTHSMIDRSLLSAFKERWRKETFSFHLPVGEMTITLDDVSSLLHLPVTGRLFLLPALGKDDANQLVVSALKVSHADAFTETDIMRDAYVRLNLLREIYNFNLEQKFSYLIRGKIISVINTSMDRFLHLIIILIKSEI
ncbi:Aminotransferase-like, plant mobile domain [Sesbania bispinosa]|nr:Aminotransferase-like, plant mobile domain [Sesbania bispinosa]